MVRSKDFWIEALSAVANMCETRPQKLKRKITDITLEKGTWWDKNFDDKRKVTIEEFTDKFINDTPEVLLDNEKYKWLMDKNKIVEFIKQ